MLLDRAASGCAPPSATLGIRQNREGYGLRYAPRVYVKIRLHTLRHTAASLLKDLGVPARDAQIILGHAHITTTQQIYTHVDEAARRHCGQEWWTAARFALRA